jgi:exodeoxyribonuclease VII small subunit
MLVYRGLRCKVNVSDVFAKPFASRKPVLREEGWYTRPDLAFDTIARPVMTSEVPASFEAALAELESIVAKMEGGQLPLKESLAAYQRGAELLQFCQNSLKEAQQQVQVLEKGVLKSFDPEAGNGGDES